MHPKDERILRREHQKQLDLPMALRLPQRRDAEHRVEQRVRLQSRLRGFSRRARLPQLDPLQVLVRGQVHTEGKVFRRPPGLRGPVGRVPDRRFVVAARAHQKQLPAQVRVGERCGDGGRQLGGHLPPLQEAAQTEVPPLDAVRQHAPYLAPERSRSSHGDFPVVGQR